ncbi:hypothetical protein F3157_06865 [Virgibacillus dakarensis]|uniref:Peptidyl-prolyl cis-trans isomerase n=1 Tax=Lentibacillus populi TaxID=1827502 RepID=A0A9W5TXN8_9BACI|nr:MULTISPECIES: hypothetical protein [Bacillaceae]MBT2216169.1 hypothetical protein [Virgibacillus dakarensis]MTW85381.1 hypothetical protein [Virgibacillus dakarensis]GGB44840.1 hypothetical protein GCM10011409_23030 [Lentibacillus populi]
MIIPITGNVNYPITLDPTVWIFDDRKILLEEAFSKRAETTVKEDEVEKASKRWDRAVFQSSKPPVNPNISRKEGEKILTNSYVMPIRDFIDNAEWDANAEKAVLVTSSDEITISLDLLRKCLLLFAIDGKIIKEDGPVYIFYPDGSNMDNPIKGLQKIIIK